MTAVHPSPGPPLAARRRSRRWSTPDPGRHHRGDRLRRCRARPDPRPPPEHRTRRPAGPGPRRRPARRDPPAPGHDRARRPFHAPAGRCRLPGPAPRDRRGARPGADRRRHRGRSTSGPTSACAIRRTTRAGTASSIRGPTCSSAPSTACPSSIGPSSQAPGRCRGRDRRVTRLLPDGDDPGAGATGPGRADRRSRRRREERRLRRRPRVEGRAHVRRGQREREGVRPRRPPPRRRDRAGTGRGREPRGPRPGGESRRDRGRLPPPPDPDDPRDPLDQPRPPDATGHPGRARRALCRRVRGRAVRHGRRDAAGHEARHRQQRGPDPRPTRRADRTRARHRGRGQPRQGRRRPGRPVVQPRARPAGDDRPARSCRWRHDDRASAPRSSSPSERLPSVERRATMPGGFRANGLDGRDQGLGPAGPRASSSRRTDRPRRPRSSPRTRSRPRPSDCRGNTFRGRRAIRRAGFGWAQAVISTSGSANAATGDAGDADQRAIATTLAEAVGISARTDAPPLDRRHRDATAARPRRGGHRLAADLDPTRHRTRGDGDRAADDRLGRQGGDRPRSTLPDADGRRGHGDRQRASPRASG